MPSIKSYAIPFKVPGSQRERQILHYFCVQGSYEVAGWFNAEFWTRAVFQQSHRDPVVRYALISLGMLHLECTTTRLSELNTAGALTLRQYGKALRALRRRLGTVDAETTRTALTCCILFYCVEAALGDETAATSHLKNGLNLLASIGPEERSRDFSAQERVLEGLDLQATLFDDERKPHLVLIPHLNRGNFSADTTPAETFRNIDEAHRALVVLQNQLFHFLTENTLYKSHSRDSLPAYLLLRKRRLLKQFDSWSHHFGRLKNTVSQDEGTVCGTEILLIHWQTSVMLLEADYPADESIFGAISDPRTEEILTIAENLLERTERHRNSDSIRSNVWKSFSSENGIVAPLFMLAMKCMDEHVCDRATALLATSQRREGLYDAQDMVATIEQFVSARQNKRLRHQEQWDRPLTGMSLERTFESELNGPSVSMNKIAECLKPITSSLL